MLGVGYKVLGSKGGGQGGRLAPLGLLRGIDSDLVGVKGGDKSGTKSGQLRHAQIAYASAPQGPKIHTGKFLLIFV